MERSQKMEFASKTVLVTGGGSGIGKAAALAYAKEGAAVALTVPS